jgi:LPXTG-motif cell wall-anchored protein
MVATNSKPAKELMMKTVFIPMVLLLALSGVPALAAGGNDQGGNNNDQGGKTKGAPGPIVGAGLPVLLIGGGIYWLVRRKKRQARNP